MEKHLPERQPDQRIVSATLPNKTLLKAVYQFNQLRAIPLTEIEMLEWARSIERLVPDLDVELLSFAIDHMKTGKIDYDKTLGIQNIFKALQLVERDDKYNLKIRRQNIW